MPLDAPQEWLPVLARKLDACQPRINKLRKYANGDAPLPEMGANTKATWAAFQKKARTNFGGIACNSHANRIRARSVRVGADDGSPASMAARRIWRDNRMPMQIGDAIWNVVSQSIGYLAASVGDDGRAIITAESPQYVYADPEPTRPWKARAAIKTWRDTVEGYDYAQVWTPGSWQRFARKVDVLSATVMVNVGGWAPISASVPIDGVPVFILDRRDGMGLIEPHLDVIDRINLGKLQRLSTAAIQAFRQRALRRQDGTRLPEKDDDGNPIDWGKIFEPAPGALWDLPAGIDIWESGTTDIRQLLDGERADARDFSAVTGTPISMLLPDGANQSATGASATTAQQVDACIADIERIRLAVAGCMLVALTIENVDIGEDTVEVDFANPAWVTLAEQMDAYSKAVASGMSVPAAQKQILGWSQDQIDEDDRYRRKLAARDAIAALAAQPAPAMTASE